MERISYMQDTGRCRKHRAIECTECNAKNTIRDRNCSVKSCIFLNNGGSGLCTHHESYAGLDPDLISRWAKKYWYYFKTAYQGQSRNDPAKYVGKKEDYELLTPDCIFPPIPPPTNEELRAEVESPVMQPVQYTGKGLSYLKTIEQIKDQGLENFVSNFKNQLKRQKSPLVMG